MTRSFHRFFILLVLFTGAGTSSAQVQTGTPPFGSFGGGPDVISLANLNSRITIPVRHKARRGEVSRFQGPWQGVAGVNVSYSLPAWFEDRNGNKVTATDLGNGAFNLTDTLGRTAISSSGFGATGNTVGVSGPGQPYTARGPVDCVSAGVLSC